MGLDDISGEKNIFSGILVDKSGRVFAIEGGYLGLGGSHLIFTRMEANEEEQAHHAANSPRVAKVYI